MVKRELTHLSAAGAPARPSGKKKKNKPPPPPSVINEEFDYPEEPDAAPEGAADADAVPEEVCFYAISLSSFSSL